MSGPTVVRLDVGGVPCRTTLGRLRQYPGSLLAVELLQNWDEQSEIFVDCDTKTFDYVLKFLRYGAKMVLPKESEQFEELKVAADHFRLPELSRLLQDNPLHVSVPRVTMDDVFRTANAAFKGVYYMSSNGSQAMSSSKGSVHSAASATGSTSSSSKQRRFRVKLIKECGDPNGATTENSNLTCQLLHVELPRELIRASHIMPKRLGSLFAQMFLGIADLFDPKNGLLLCAPIELAMDRHKLCFCLTQSGDFVCKILDGRIRKKSLFAYARKHFLGGSKKKAKPAKDYGREMEALMKKTVKKFLRKITFGMLDGQPLFLSPHKPYKRCLSVAAFFNVSFALSKGWVKPEDVGLRADFSSPPFKTLIQSWVRPEFEPPLALSQTQSSLASVTQDETEPGMLAKERAKYTLSLQAKATSENKRLEPGKPLVSAPKTKKASSKEVQSQEAADIANIAPKLGKAKALKKKTKTKEPVPTPEALEPENLSRRNDRRSKSDVKSKSDTISVVTSPQPQSARASPSKSVDIVSSLVQDDELKTAKSSKSKLDKEKKKKKSSSVKTAVTETVALVAYTEKRIASTAKPSVEGRIGEMEIRKIDRCRQLSATDDDFVVVQKSAEGNAKFLSAPKSALVHDSFFVSGDAADDDGGAELPFADATEEDIIKSGRRAKESAPYKIGQGKKMKSQFTSSLSAASGGVEAPHEFAPRGKPVYLPQHQKLTGRMQTCDYSDGRKCGKKALRALEERTRQIEEKARPHNRKRRKDPGVLPHDDFATNIQGREKTTEPLREHRRVKKHGQMQTVPRGEDVLAGQDQADLHHSQLAKRKKKQLLDAEPQGKKIKFADDDD